MSSTDPGVAATGIPARVADQVRAFGIEILVFDGVRVEPTDASMAAAIERARASGRWDAFVAIGGGSSIDTAKAVDLLTTSPGGLMDYINPPAGGGRAPASPLPRHIRAAQLLAPGADRPARDADFLPSVLIALMKDIDIPNRVAAVGFSAADVPDLAGYSSATREPTRPASSGSRRLRKKAYTAATTTTISAA